MIRQRTKDAGRRLRGWVASFFPAVAVLLYHRVATEPFDPFGLCVSPDNFEDQLACLAGRYPVLSIDELTHRPTRRLPKRAVLLTFDDGYADVWSRAAPMLALHRTPAVAFINTGALGNAAFWWDDLTHVLCESVLPEVLKLRVDGATVEWRPSETSGRLEVYREVHYRLRAASTQARGAALDDLRSQVEPVSAPPLDRRPMTEAELCELVAGGWVKAGSHTVTHPSLPTETEDVQRREIVEDKNKLESLLETTIDSFAYPHGHFNDATARLVRDSGFRAAFAADPGLVSPGGDRYRLPRLYVPDCDGRTLTAHLDAWFSGNAKK